MAHIKLAAPVTHIWYFKGVPSRLDLGLAGLLEVLLLDLQLVAQRGRSS